MSVFRTPVALLEASASLYPSSPAFRVPHLDPRTGKVQDWQSITYTEFKKDVELSAKYWERTLKDIPRRSVVGLWIGGLSYQDVLYIYGVYRADYIPQLFSLRLPSPEVIFELLRKANAKALVYDPSFESLINDSPVPTFLVRDAKDAGTIPGDLPEMSPVSGDDPVFIFHTSGSTSGSPKLVPWSYSWLRTSLDKVQLYANRPSAASTTGEQEVGSWIGSMCHAGQSHALIDRMSRGACTVQPTTISFSSEELIDMIERCGLNHLVQFPPFLVVHLRRARQDPKLFALLRGLKTIHYGGLPIAREDEEWAANNGIILENMFGCTECGFFMYSPGGKDEASRLFSPLFKVSPNLRHELRPVFVEDDSGSGNQSTPKLLEMVVLADSPDCPHPSLRHADGNFHTGDLFEEIIPGRYASRGRQDDWIKSANALRCDTKAIEENVRETCGHLIEECVVVGEGRPSPALFVESAVNMDHDALKKEIIRLTGPFHSRRYMHERIVSEQLVIVVPPKTLPRTSAKGNIRRKAVQEAYKSQLDEIYNSLQ